MSIDVEAVIETLAELYFEYTQKLEAELKKHSDDDLRALIQHMDVKLAESPPGDRSWYEVWRLRAEAEIGLRWHVARATALQSECYCVHHACDFKDCPSGFHDD